MLQPLHLAVLNQYYFDWFICGCCFCYSIVSNFLFENGIPNERKNVSINIKRYLFFCVERSFSFSLSHSLTHTYIILFPFLLLLSLVPSDLIVIELLHSIRLYEWLCHTHSRAYEQTFARKWLHFDWIQCIENHRGEKRKNGQSEKR